MPDPLLVLDISLSGPERDHDETVTFLDRELRLLRIGTGGDLDRVEELARTWTGRARAIAVSGLDRARGPGLRPTTPHVLERVRRAAPGVPTTDGHHLAGVLQEWAVRHVHTEMPGYFSNARTLVLGGAGHERTTRALREHTDNISFADLLLRLDLSERMAGLPLLGLAASTLLRPVRLVPEAARSTLVAPAAWLGQALARRAARDADVIVATYDELMGFGPEDLTGKCVISSTVYDERLAELAARGVDMVLDSVPQPFPVAVNAAMFEAMMRAVVSGGRLTDDDLLDMIVDAGMEPRVLHPNGFRRKSRFAFVIHPLSRNFFTKVEPLGTLTAVAPAPVGRMVEKAVAYAPPFTYSHVTGITSPTGAEAEGWLISVGGTPRELMAHDPEFTYARLLQAAEMARGLGAQVMGLGAFTKVVGDAGVTVAKKASLPVTTGNSYSASGALWAAHDAVRRLGLARVDDDGRIHGNAMVVGATGAIGSVCARLLALASDEIWLVSPETAKLLTLKRDIEREHPRATVHVAATPDDHLGEMDVIVTATSGAGKRVLDITAVKPGCVITDVARPLDLSAEDVAKRPDVLVVESGEIELPGDVHMRDIGLPHNVVYACMAETVVLALEGRYETFTVGRSIEWERVKEIYRLGLKHGMRLAAITGVNGVFTDEQLAEIRERALEARAAASRTPGTARTRATAADQPPAASTEQPAGHGRHP